MLRRIRRLPSPAIVISAIALIVAVGGGSYALAISDNAKDKKIATNVANKRINTREPKLEVLHATSARHAGSAANAAHATNADSANRASSADAATSAASAQNANTVGGLTVKQWSVKVPREAIHVPLIDTGLVHGEADCDPGGHLGAEMDLSKDSGAPTEAMVAETVADGQVITAERDNFAGVTLAGLVRTAVGHAEVTTTTGKSITLNYMARGAPNFGLFGGGEQVCVFSGTAIYG